MNKLQAPWTSDQVDALNRFQRAGSCIRSQSALAVLRLIASSYLVGAADCASGSAEGFYG
jgi:hypothetical protein